MSNTVRGLAGKPFLKMSTNLSNIIRIILLSQSCLTQMFIVNRHCSSISDIGLSMALALKHIIMLLLLYCYHYYNYYYYYYALLLSLYVILIKLSLPRGIYCAYFVINTQIFVLLFLLLSLF